ncbi:MAG: hemerythrin domain-containing protein [Pseudonocardiales bacterium]|nr:hemerythrin domain-containing protein [Pseudonocardiales bacterium]
MDITDLILHDHHEQRRMFALLDEAGTDPAVLGPIWDRLAILLEVHAEAEEQLFYPRLLDVGEGAGGEDSAEAETTDAIADHNDIRDAVARAGRHPVGSPEWRQSVVEARTANGDHMAEEERGPLADFRQRADLQVRHDLGVAFASFEAAHAGGVDSRDSDPDTYVEQHSG